MSKKIIITGAAGFIGSALTAHLNKKGYKIYAVDNLTFGSLSWIEPHIESFYHADIRNYNEINRIFSEIKPQIVIHLAALHFIPYCNQNPIEAAEVNITGTFNIVEASKNLNGLESLFFASTAAVYPISNFALAETVHPQPMDIYGITKLAGEKIVESFALKSTVKTTIARFFNAFGPNETNPHLIPEVEKQLKSGSKKIKLGNLEPKRDFIHTYDMANAVECMLNRESTQFDIFNLGRGIEYSVQEIVDAFSSEMNFNIEVETDPSRIRKVERMHLLADISKLTSETGWKPAWTLEMGIHQLMTN